jgi:hypothetical protein
MYKIRGADGKEYGPASVEQMRQWLAENRINASTLVQVEGTTTWVPLSALPEFAAEAGAAPASEPAPLAASFGPVDSRNVALGKVQGPAIALIVVATIYILLSILGLFTSSMGTGMRTMRSSGNPELDRILFKFSGGAGVLAAILHVGCSAFSLFGALKMKKLENYGLVMAATIIGMLPCISPCCFLGLPFGIWALVVLNEAEVKSSFQ